MMIPQQRLEHLVEQHVQDIAPLANLPQAELRQQLTKLVRDAEREHEYWRKPKNRKRTRA